MEGYKFRMENPPDFIHFFRQFFRSFVSSVKTAIIGILHYSSKSRFYTHKNDIIEWE